MTFKLIGRDKCGDDHGRYAEEIIRPFELRVTREMIDDIKQMADEIYDDEFRCYGRALHEVREFVAAGRLLEYALCQQTGFTHNKGFDKSDPETYNHDARDGSVKFEVKPWKEDWMSWREFKYGRKTRGPMETFRRHCESVDYLVAGKLIEKGPVCRGHFHMVARAHTFKKGSNFYVTRGIWDENVRVYYHQSAAADGEAIYRSDLCA